MVQVRGQLEVGGPWRAPERGSVHRGPYVCPDPLSWYIFLGLTWLRTSALGGFARTLPFHLKVKAKENGQKLGRGADNSWARLGGCAPLDAT